MNEGLWEVCIVLKSGGFIPFTNGPLDQIGWASQYLFDAMREFRDKGDNRILCDGVRNDENKITKFYTAILAGEIAGFYIRRKHSEIDAERHERQVKAMERLAKAAAGDGESWKGDDEA